jgi:hypothetical protein
VKCKVYAIAMSVLLIAVATTACAPGVAAHTSSTNTALTHDDARPRSRAVTNFRDAIAAGATVAEARALMKVGHFRMKDASGNHLMYALVRGLLIMYYGDPDYPEGIVPRGEGDCPDQGSGPCRHGYHVIGGDNDIYFPEPTGGPGGSRLAHLNSVYRTDVDRFARSVYAHEGLRQPWGQDL